MVEYEKINPKINIKDIMPFYSITGVFSFLDEKQKLNMIQYNKELQKIFLVDIKDYKRISGKYKIGKKNGKGKEYNFYGKLIFSGEYLKGKRNGEGKEYYDNGKI